MLRLHFTADDLARVLLVAESFPKMGEAVLSLQALRRTDQETQFGQRRRGLRGRLPAEVRPLWDLVPSQGWVPDFLTPYRDATVVPAALDVIRSHPGRQIVADLERLATDRPLPGWVRGLAHGDPDAPDSPPATWRSKPTSPWPRPPSTPPPCATPD
ncbi:hypothetical protein QMK19_37255 [Streptomyces sp. H10-C2]|uniref:hypothetical protein n=1 Tax=unclassified Streptomyces TaxID=2593676 RepID=UPI0024BB765F|nr:MULTISPECIES: hypothetical protein [unclassified Streptomyces]MDJ0347309.1 hypothetical protein [Streptomyces sp. PH10-H1]MDJ0375106.1 hypothetical protein [Streptomyces sp. H10-C2]